MCSKKNKICNPVATWTCNLVTMYKDSGLLYPTWGTSLEETLELPNLPDDDLEAWSHL